MLTTIPAYFALSDLGFASAATSDMTIQLARGYRRQVRTTFQSIWILVNVVSLIVLFATGATLLTLAHFDELPSWLGSRVSTIIFLVVYSAVAMNTRILLAGLRATQNYAQGTLLHECLAILETLAVLLVASLGYEFLECVEVMLLLRLTNLFLLWQFLRHRVAWLTLGTSDASWQEIKRLWIPALAAMSIPTAIAANLQGTVLIAGIFISAGAAATLVSVRTASRIAVQFIGAINRATMPELSAAGARENRETLTKIVAINLATVALVLVPTALLLALFGSELVRIWTHGHIYPDRSFVCLIAFAMTAHGLWYYTSNLLLASSAHTLIARRLLVISVSTMFATIPLSLLLGLTGVGLTLAIAEVASLVGVFQVAARLRLIGLREIEYALKLRFWPRSK